MIHPSVRLLATVVAATALNCAAPAGVSAQTNQGGSRVFGDLLKRIPEQSNVLLLADVEGLLNSPMGQREKWREQAASRQGEAGGLPAGTSKLAVAMGMDFTTGRENWKVGMVQLNGEVPDLEALAAREGGYVETIGNMPVVWTPRGFDLFRFPEGTVGFVSPTNRQGVVGWIRDTLSKPRTFPPGFASRAIFRADAGAQIALALDLSDVASPKAIEPWLNAIEIIKKTKTDAGLLAPRLASVKSAILTIKADQTLEGTLRIDFARPVDYTAPVARELILTLLDDYGAELPELKTWNLSFDQKTSAVEMTGRTSVESVRRVLSLASPPRLSYSGGGADVSAPAPASEKKPGAPSKNDTLAASQGYYRAITGMIASLKGTERPTYRSLKLWFDRYAKQIEELPILGVDRDLLDWGSNVSRTLRSMASGINYNAQNQNYAVASTPNGAYGGYGYYSVESKAYDQAVIKRQSDALMNVSLDKTWQDLENSAADMRRKMVEKYMVDF